MSDCKSIQPRSGAVEIIPSSEGNVSESVTALALCFLAVSCRQQDYALFSGVHTRKRGGLYLGFSLVSSRSALTFTGATRERGRERASDSVVPVVVVVHSPNRYKLHVQNSGSLSLKLRHGGPQPRSMVVRVFRFSVRP